MEREGVGREERGSCLRTLMTAATSYSAPACSAPVSVGAHLELCRRERDDAGAGPGDENLGILVRLCCALTAAWATA